MRVLSFIHPKSKFGYSDDERAKSVLHGRTNLEKQKFLSIAERKASRRKLRAELLQSEGQTYHRHFNGPKIPGSGTMETQEYHVEAP